MLPNYLINFFMKVLAIYVLLNFPEVVTRKSFSEVLLRLAESYQAKKFQFLSLMIGSS